MQRDGRSSEAQEFIYGHGVERTLIGAEDYIYGTIFLGLLLEPDREENVAHVLSPLHARHVDGYEWIRHLRLRRRRERARDELDGGLRRHVAPAPHVALKRTEWRRARVRRRKRRYR